MPLYLCEIMHFTTSLLIFWWVKRRFKVWYMWSFIGAMLGGFLIDSDHMIDQFIAFGFDLSLEKFVMGSSFIQTDMAYIFFHGWEYVLLLFMLYFFLRDVGRLIKWQAFFLAMALSMFGHLMVDSNTNHMSYNSYSILYRIEHRFEMEKMINPELWWEHLQDKKDIS